MSASAVNAAQTAALKALVGTLLEANEPEFAMDALIALEGVVVGTFLMIVRLGGDEPVLDVFADRLRERLAEARLGRIQAGGRA